ncbi:hypothetical protein I7I48_01547 [Histoplasma ohiense]|nr:hypothetical protein I7I48_01547 [Histoplasma ohiense (nom. inval.)]
MLPSTRPPAAVGLPIFIFPWARILCGTAAEALHRLPGQASYNAAVRIWVVGADGKARLAIEDKQAKG